MNINQSFGKHYSSFKIISLNYLYYLSRRVTISSWEEKKTSYICWTQLLCAMQDAGFFQILTHLILSGNKIY